MRVYDVYDVRRGVIVATVSAFSKDAACTKVATSLGLDATHLAAALQ